MVKTNFMSFEAELGKKRFAGPESDLKMQRPKKPVLQFENMQHVRHSL